MKKSMLMSMHEHEEDDTEVSSRLYYRLQMAQMLSGDFLTMRQTKTLTTVCWSKNMSPGKMKAHILTEPRSIQQSMRRRTAAAAVRTCRWIVVKARVPHCIVVHECRQLEGRG